jgi:parallel beta-helix repeat protein
MGTGHHLVERVLSTNNTVRGFRIAAGSDQNNLDQNAATTNGFNGFQVGGMQSTLTNNTATQNQFGFYIVDTLSGSSQHTLRRNTAALNTLLGFLDSDAEHLTLVKNVAQQNGDSGFLLFGSGHTVRQN